MPTKHANTEDDPERSTVALAVEVEEVVVILGLVLFASEGSVPVLVLLLDKGVDGLLLLLQLPASSWEGDIKDDDGGGDDDGDDAGGGGGVLSVLFLVDD